MLAIIGLLATYVAPQMFGQVSRSRQKMAASQIEAFARALGAFRLDVGRYPSTEEGLAALRSAPAGAGRWNGPYIDKPVPMDPWDTAYVYRHPGTDGRDFDIISYGRDGVAGGSGDAADLTNR